MTKKLESPIESVEIPQELTDIVKKCFKKKPAREDLESLKSYLQENPQLYREALDLSKFLQDRLIEKILKPETKSGLPTEAGYITSARLAIQANVSTLKNGMGYDHAPTIEQLLIENIVASWLHLQWVELNIISHSVNGGNPTLVEWWDNRVSSAQRRYLRAVETLARVRKLARNTPALQVNIATESGQQLNVSGNLNRYSNKD